MPDAASFSDRLTAAVKRCRTPVVVGLDPRREHLPEGLLPKTWGDEVDAIAQAYRWFCHGIIDVVAELVPAVKPQAAFFEQLGPAGMRVLGQVIAYARERGLLVILDGKRNDIGSTAEAYADAYLGTQTSVWGADALTVSPYLGDDSLLPFVRVAEARSSGIFVLIKTSNPGSAALQDLVADGEPVYVHVARHVNRLAADTAGPSGYGAIGGVVGATYPEQLAEIRQLMPQSWLLMPGFGTQGATARDVAGGFDERGLGGIVNSSRGIIFAHKSDAYEARFGGAQWQRAVEAATRDMIDQLRTETAARHL